MNKRILRGTAVALCVLITVAAFFAAWSSAIAQSPGGSIIRQISLPSERLDLYLNSSRLISLQQAIPKAMVQNPEIAELIPRSENQILVVAKKAGFTTVTLWDADGKTYTIDVLVKADGRQLEIYLKRQFPKASLTVTPLNHKVIIEGNVNESAHVNQIIEIAKDFYPDVINRITVGGVQQVLLHVKVMEVSRTKLRRLGFDWAKITGDDFVAQGVSGLITGLAGGVTAPITGGAETFTFGIVNGNSAFFGVLDALRQNNLMKVLAEPSLVTISGRPAFFNSGGEFPILVPGSLGTVSIEYKKFGTQVDFLPIVLSNGHIRLEVRPRISEIDPTRSVTLGSFTVPGLRVREIDTGVELRAGQTLAIAGLVQTRIESRTVGIPWLMDIPWIGAAFRGVQHEENEIELLVLVTPELVHGLEYDEVPQGGPGLSTTSPCDTELFFKGYLEVPKCMAPNFDDANYAPGGPAGTEVVPLPDSSANRMRNRPNVSTSGLAPSNQRQARSRAIRQTASQGPAPRSARKTNRYDPSNAQRRSRPRRSQTVYRPPGFIGPTGYDVRN